LIKFTSKVVSCTAAQIDRVVQGKKEKVEGYEVLLEDTVFFPEGGGQVKLKNYKLCILKYTSQFFIINKKAR